MTILKKVLDFVMDILETVTFVGSLFIVVYLFIIQPNEVRGSSMDTTFAEGEYILTNKLAYKFGEPERGDVVVFVSPENEDQDFIKRIIAIPGDTVMILNGRVYVNGQMLSEQYIQEPTNPEGGFIVEGREETIPDGHVFVMGDNRPKSKDSRVFGPIPYSSIIGEVFFRYFPADKLGTIHNPYAPKS